MYAVVVLLVTAVVLAGGIHAAHAQLYLSDPGDRSVSINSTLRIDIGAHGVPEGKTVTYGIEPLEGARIHPVSGHLVYLPAGPEGQQNITVTARAGSQTAAVNITVTVGAAIAILENLTGADNSTQQGVFTAGAAGVEGRFGYHDGRPYALGNGTAAAAGGSPGVFGIDRFDPPHPISGVLYYYEIRRTSDDWGQDGGLYTRFAPEMNGSRTIPNPVTRPVPVAPGLDVSVNSSMPITLEPLLVGLDGGVIAITAVTNGTQGTAGHTDTTITYAPGAGAAGGDTINYTVTDDRGVTGTGTITITVLPDSINLPGIADQSVKAHTTLRIPVEARNATGPVTYSIDAHEGARIHPVTGHLVYVPVADHAGTPQTLTVRAHDDTGMASTTVDVTVGDWDADPARYDPDRRRLAVRAGDQPVNVVFYIIQDDSRQQNGPSTTINSGVRAQAGHYLLGPEHPLPNALYYADITPQGDRMHIDGSTFVRYAPGQDGFEIIPNPNSRPDPYAPDITGKTFAGTPVVITPELTGFDGGNITITHVTDGTDGTANHTDTAITYTPGASFTGSDTVTYTVTDDRGATTTGAINITVLPPRPLSAVSDTAYTDEDVPVNIDVTANDAADIATVEVSVPPRRGEAVPEADGTITYSPGPNYHGRDTFVYALKRGTAVQVATVTVNVRSITDVPSFEVPQNPPGAEFIAVPEMEPYGFDLNVTNPDSVRYRLSVVPGDPAADGAAINGIAESFTWTPSERHGPGVYNVTIALDPVPESLETVYKRFTLSVTEENRAPVFAMGRTHGAVSGSALILELAARDADEPAQNLAYSIDGPGLGAFIVGDTLVWHPDANHTAGPQNLTVLVRDNFTTPGQDAITLTIDVTEGTGPVISDTPDNPSRAAHTTLRIGMRTSESTGDVSWSMAPLEGARIHPASGHISYVPDLVHAGATQALVVSATDDAGTTVRVIPVEVREPFGTFNHIRVVQTDRHEASYTGHIGTTYLTFAVSNNNVQRTTGFLTVDEGVTQILDRSNINEARNKIYYFLAGDYDFPRRDAANIYAKIQHLQDGYEIIPNPNSRPNPFAPHMSRSIELDMPAVFEPELVGIDGGNITITGAADGRKGDATHTATSVTYHPGQNVGGVDRIAYTVRDDRGATGTGYIHVTLPDVPLVARDDHYYVREDGRVLIRVLDNDDQNNVTITTTQPKNGELELLDFGHMWYYPNRDYNGVERFEYTITRGNESSTATVAIGISSIDDLPVVGGIEDAVVPELETYRMPLNIIDVDGSASQVYSNVSASFDNPPVISGDHLVWTPTEAQGPGSYRFAIITSTGLYSTTQWFTFNVTEVNQKPVFDDIETDQNATVGELYRFDLNTTDADWPPQDVTYHILWQSPPGNLAVLNNTSGEITWTPDAAGSRIISMYARDDQLPSGRTAITLNITAAWTPLAAANDTAGTTAGTPVRIDVLANDAAHGATLQVSDPVHGNATVTESDGTVTYSPDQNYTGPDMFEYTISREGQNRTATVFIEVISPDALPAFEVPTDAGFTVIPELEPFWFDINATDPENIGYVLAVDPGDPPAAGAAITQSGRFAWTPTESQGPGMYNVTIILDPVLEGIANITQQIALSVTEANSDPVFDDIEADQTVIVGESFTPDLNATDADDPRQTVSYQIVSQNPPENPAVINGTTGQITWTPAVVETRTITVQASDDFVPRGTANVTLTVSVRTEPPLATIMATPTENGVTLAVTPSAIYEIIGRVTHPNGTVVHEFDPVTPNATGVPVTFVASGVLEPETAYHYQFARSNDTGYAGGDVAYGSFATTVQSVIPIVLGSITPQQASEGVAINYTIDLANPAMHAITWNITSESRGAVITDDGRFVWMPGEEHGGNTYEFEFTAVAPTNTVSAMIPVAVNEINQDPVFEEHDTYLFEFTNSTLTFDLNATDADDPPQTISYQIVSQDPPENPAVINGTTGLLTWTPTVEQTRAITVQASDDYSPNGTVQTILAVAVLDEPQLAITFAAVIPAERVVRFGILPASADPIIGRVLDGNGTTVHDFGTITPEGRAVPVFPAPEIPIASLAPDATYTYQFARAGDAGYAGGDIEEDTFFIPAREPDQVAAPIAVLPAQPQSVPEGGTVDYAIPVDNADSQAINWTVTSGSPGADITADGRFVWTPGEEHGGNTYEFEFVAEAPTNRENGTISVMVSETNQDPVFVTTEAVFLATSAVPFTHDLNATDADIPEQDLTYYIVNQSDSANEAVIDPDNGTISWTPDAPGTKTIRAAVHDGFAAPGNDTLDITINVTDAPSPNTPPTAGDILEAVAAGRSVIIDLSLRIGDEQQSADTLRVSISDPPSQGTAAVSGITINYTAFENATGTDTFNYTVTDSDGANATAAANITINNPADSPISFQTIEPQSADEGDTARYQMPLDNPAGLNVTWSVSSGQRGDAAVNGSGFFIWSTTEDDGSETAYEFGINATAGNATITGTLSVAVNETNQDPVFDDVRAEYNQTTGVRFTLDLNATDDDRPEQTLTYSIERQSAGASNATIDPGNGTIIWTPDAPGTKTVRAAVRDNFDPPGSDTLDITINVTDAPPPNTPPTADSINETVTAGQSVLIDLSLDDRIGDDQPTDTLEVAISDPPSQGNAAVDGITINYTAFANATGTDTFRYTVTDDGSENATATVTVRINPAGAPISFQTIEPQSADEGDTVGYQMPLDNPAGLNVTWSVSSGQKGDAAVSDTGFFTWTTTEADGGQTAHRFGISATAGSIQVTGNLSVAVNETNQDPVFDDIKADQNATVGELYRLDLNATDADDPPQAVTYHITAQNPPENPAVINTTTGYVTWTPAIVENRTITVQASDDYAPNGTAEITITVTVGEPAKVPPLATVVAAPTESGVTLAATPSAIYEIIGRVTHPNGTVVREFDPVTPDAAGEPVPFVIPDGLEPETTYHYWFARSGDTGYAGDDVVSGVFTTLMSSPAQIGLGALAPPAASEGVELIYPIPAENPDGQTIAWRITSERLGADITADGRFVWIPGESDGGETREFEFTAEAPTNTVNGTISVMVNETNQDPVFEAHDAGLSEFTNNTLTFDLNATDADYPPQAVTYAIVSQDPSGNPAVINGTTGLITWTPAAAQMRTITVRASDDYAPNGTVDTTLTVTVRDEPPLATVSAAVSADGQKVTFDIVPSAAGPIIGRVLDGNGMTVHDFGTVTPGGLGVQAFLAPEIPLAGLAPDAVYTYQFARGDDAGYAGDDIVEGTFVTPAQAPSPIAVLPAQPQSVPEGGTVDYAIPLDNADSQAINWTVTSGSLGADITADGRLVWTPGEEHGGNTYEFEFAAEAPTNTASGTVSVAVAETNEDPAFDDIIEAGQDATAGEPFTLDLNATDGDIPEQALTYSITDQSDSTSEAAIDPVSGIISWMPDEPGTKTIRAAVHDGHAPPGSDTLDIVIAVSGTPANAPPVLDDIADMSVSAGRLLAFTAGAGDANGDPLTFDLADAPGGATINATTGDFRWAPEASQTGDHPVTVTVSDGRGGADSKSFAVMVTGPNQDPAAPDILINAELHFPSAVTPVVADPDGDDITITGVTGATLGSLDTGMLPQISYTPGQTGIDRINYTASDGRRGTDTGTITVFINPEGNARPVLEHIHSVGARVGEDLELTARAGDPDDTSLTFDIANAPDGASIAADGKFSWRPAESQNGTHTVTFVVHDGRGGADWQHVAVTVLRADEVNLAPVSEDISTTVVLGGGRGFQPDIVDPEGDQTAIVRVYDSSLGDVDRSFLSQGVIVYVAGVLGNDEVVYTVSDGRGGFANGTISITVEEPANVRPIIEFIGDKSVNAGDELVFSIGATDIDGFVAGFDLKGQKQGASIGPRGDFRWTPTAEGRYDFTVIVFDDADGNSTESITVTVRPEDFENSPPVAPDVVIMTPQDVLSIVRPTLTDPDEGDPVQISGTGDATKGRILAGFLRAGIIIYLPNQGETGTETIPYTIADSSDGNDTAAIHVFISARGNTDPILGSIDFRNINAGDSLALDLEAEDPDGDAISYLPVGAPDGIEISPEGAFSWTPAAADVGNHTFTVIAYDDRGGADSKTAVIRVLPAGTANQAPNAPDSTVTVAPGGSVVITPAISDPDGDRVAITNAVAGGTGVVIPSEDSINYIHIATTPTETITYAVTDARGATSTGTITITIQ